MTFANPGELVRNARRDGYAVPAFNTNGATYDITRAALEAADYCGSPLILQVYEPNTEYRGFRHFVNLAAFLCDDLKVRVPVALQLDHGHSHESVVAAMDAGFTGVMFDASHEPLDENIAQTARVVEEAHERGVAVEAEVGHVKGNEPPTAPQIGRIPVPERPETPPAKTSVPEAKSYVEAVDVDMLAVSIGTTHGVLQRQGGIDWDLLAALRDAVDIPLVQHGTGGIPIPYLSRLAESGMSKINFGEPFRFNYINYFVELVDGMEHLWHPWRIMRKVKDRLKDDMKALILALRSHGRAT